MITTLPKFSEINLNEVPVKLEQLLQRNLLTITELLQTNSQEIDSEHNQARDQQSGFTWQNLMLPLEELDDELNQFWSPISHLHSVADNELIRTIYNQCLPKLTEYHMKISHNQALFAAINSIADSETYHQLNQAQRKIIEHQLRDFKLAGVSLPSKQQQAFTQLVTELSQLGTQFEENLLDATKAWTKHITKLEELSGLPPFALAAAAENAKQKGLEGWLLNLEPANYRAVITYADSPTLRQEIYTAYVTRASDQGPFAGQWDNQLIIEQILLKRLQAAKLLGFNNFAEESLATKMAKSPEEVLNFLQSLMNKAKPIAEQEFKQLSNYAEQFHGVQVIQAWDMAYYSEKLRQHDYNISQEELRPYFPEYKVLSGIFEIIKRLYGMDIKQVADADTWHPDVRCYAIHDENQVLRSYFYLDLYARPSKRGGAWMDDCRVRRRRQNGELQLPIAYVNCNFNGPTADTPALFAHDDVVTLFHELGHALHHVLTQIDYADVSGINGVPWDAVEFPSQFFEHWGWEQASLNLLTEHYQTHEPLPVELFQRMHKAKNFQSALQLVRQTEFGLYDFRLHVEFDPAIENQAQRILDEVRQLIQLYPVPEFNRFQNGFSHIFAGGYAAGYYSYHWAEVMACDAFEPFKKEGIFNAAISRKFLTNILEKGGSEEPLDLFIRFRGRPPEIQALLDQKGILSNV